MKKLAIIIFIFSHSTIYSQLAYFKDLNGIGLFDLSTCDPLNYIDTSPILKNSVYGEFSMNASGQYFFVASYVLFKYTSFNMISGYMIPPGTNLPNTSNGVLPQYYAGKSDYKNTIYCAGNGLCSYDTKSTILRYYGDATPFFYDAICFYQDKLIGIAISNNQYERHIVDINLSDPKSSKILFTLDTLAFGFHPLQSSLTAITYDCDSTTIYYLVTSNENNMVVTYIYFLDIKNKNIRLFCRQPLYIYGICSLEEFKTSRCILSIDLDEDDSTIKGNSFKDSIACVNDKKLPIHDNDLWLYSNGSIDSMFIRLLDPLPDQTFEELNYKMKQPMVSITKNSNREYVLYNEGMATSIDFKLQLNQFYYSNIKRNYTNGERTIRVIVYSGFRSDSADAYLYLNGPLLAGIDTNTTICPNEKDLDLFELLQSPKTAGGFWVYNNAPHTGILNPKIDQSGIYYYILDRKDCSSDTATLTLTILPELNPSLGNDRSICPNKSIVLKPKDRGSRILWSDNSSRDSLIVTSPGQYFVKLIDTLGCEYSDTIVIIKSDYNIESVDTNYCFGNIFDWRNQKIQADGVYQDTSKFSLNCDTIFTLRIKFLAENKLLKTQSICPQDSFLFKSKFYKSGEIIHDTIVSIISCDTIVEIGINEFVVSKINFNTDTIICRGEVVNLGAPTNFQSYKWSTGEDKSSIQVRSGTYTLTVTDVNGCNVNSSITIKESPTIQYNAIPIDPLCPEDKGSIEITNLQGGTAPLEYYLNGKKVSLSSLDYLNSGLYIFKAIDSENCEVSDTIQILDAAVFDVSIKELIELEEGESYSLSFANHNPKISSIQVSPNSDVFIQNGTELKFSPKEDITYTLTFTDERGCELIKTITFTIKRNEGFYPPTIFSPNGDNINDTWQPTYGNVYTLVSASIFDRWGEQVYYTNNPSVEWNGTYKSQQCNPGVYVYLIELRHRDGSVKKFSGDVSLIR